MSIVPLRDVPVVWPRVKFWLDEAMEGSLGESSDDLYRACLEDRAQLWTLPKAAAVSRVIQARKKVLHIVALGGEGVDEWIGEFVSEWKDFARKNGCVSLLAIGRPGWKRVFPRIGFSVKKITGVCEVGNA